MICSNCGSALPENAKFCTVCGTKAAAPAPEMTPAPETTPVPEAPPKPVCISCGAELGDGERFCTVCGTPVAGGPAQAQAAPPPKRREAPAPQYRQDAPEAYAYGQAGAKKKRKKSAFVRLLWLWILLLVLIGGVAFGFLYVTGNHEKAVSAMREMDFAAARAALERTIIGDKLYADDAALIDAGLLMEDGKLDKAIKAFEKLEDHENAAECALEAKYRKAELLFKEEAHDEAIELYETLGKYKDSAEKIVAAQLAKANALLASGKDAEAITLLKKLAADGSEEAKKKIAQLEQTIYEQAAVAYRNGAYDEAESLLIELGAYERSADYLTLISARRSIENATAGDTTLEPLLWDALVPLIGFEDAAAVILSSVDMTYWFMTGDWENADGSIYFRLSPQPDSEYYNVHYNFPWYAEDGYFSIEPGGYYTETDSGNKTYDTLRFTIIDASTVDIYCFKDNTTTTMIRQ